MNKAAIHTVLLTALGVFIGNIITSKYNSKMSS